MNLTATTQQVALVERELEAARQPTDAFAAARESARNAALGLAVLQSLFDGVIGPSPATRECPACGKTVMAAATRCGFCWTKLTALARE